MAAMTRISGARPGQTAEQVASTLQKLQDLAGVPEKLDATVSSFTNVFVRGQLSPKALKGFFEATGVNLRIELAKTYGVTADQFTKLMGKKGLAPSALNKIFEDTITRLTAVGERFHGRAKAFLETFEGIQLRFKYLWENFASGFGHTVENLITPIANDLLDIFSNERMGKMFLELQAWATRIGYAVTFLIGEIQKSGIEEQFQRIGKAVSQLFGGFNLNAFYKDVYIGSDIQRKITASGQSWIDGLNASVKLVGTLTNIVTQILAVNDALDKWQTKFDEFTAAAHAKIFSWSDQVAEKIQLVTIQIINSVIDVANRVPGVNIGRIESAGASANRASFGAITQQISAMTEMARALQFHSSAHVAAAQKNIAMLEENSAALKKVTGNDLGHFGEAIDAVTAKLLGLAGVTGGGGGGAGGGAFRGTHIPYRHGAGGYPTDTTPTAQGYRILEEYSYEGRSSQIGPRGNVIKTGEIGLGHELEKQYNIKQGDWVQTSGHGWRKVTESSNSAYGIEYHADKPGQFAGGSEREKILSVRHANDVMASHAFGGIFNVPHIASIVERGLSEAR